MISIEVTFIGIFTDAQKDKIKNAITLWEKALDSDYFKKLVLAFRFSQTNDSSQKVYDTYTAVKDKKVSYAVSYAESGSEIAVTDLATNITTIDADYFDKQDVFQCIETLSHEYSHTSEGGGYKHSYFYSRWLPWTWNRPQSVPYALGQIISDIARTL